MPDNKKPRNADGHPQPPTSLDTVSAMVCQAVPVMRDALAAELQTFPAIDVIARVGDWRGALEIAAKATRRSRSSTWTTPSWTTPPS